jgi:hypothetical protein
MLARLATICLVMMFLVGSSPGRSSAVRALELVRGEMDE